MGKVKQLWQDERDKRHTQHYNDYLDCIPESERGVTTIDAALRYADEMMEEEDAERDGPEPNE